jgi:small subunit ribosomal protein S3Ae
LSSKKGARVRDKWRLKTWYTVCTPPYFGGFEITSVPASDGSKVVGRVVETTLYDITKQDISQINTKIFFQITGTQGTKTETIFKGHEYSREFLRSLVRRGSSRIDGIFNVQTKDGYILRVYAVTFSRKRLNPSQETAVRKIMQQIIEEKAKNLLFDQIVQELVLGKVASDIYNQATKIAPLRHVGIRKSRLVSTPTPAAETKSVAS